MPRPDYMEYCKGLSRPSESASPELLYYWLKRKCLDYSLYFRNHTI